MSEVYQAPQAELTETTPEVTFGSVDKAIQGDYSLQVGPVISEAWARVSGCKWKVQLALGLYFLIYFALMAGLAFIFHSAGLRGEVNPELQKLPESMQILFGGGMAESIILTILLLPAGTGIAVLGLRRAVDAPIRAMDILKYYDRIIPLIITYVILYLLMMLGFVLLIIPGVYLMVAYSMALILVVDKKLSPWQALETSRKAITKRWFSFFGLYLSLGIIAALSAIPLGIGLIWTIPLYLIAMGVAYRNMFGCEAETCAN